MRVIKTEKDYDSALMRIELLMDQPETEDVIDEIEVLSILVDHYEKENYPISPPDPIEAIKFRMDQLGLKSKDLGKIIKSKSRASEVLNRKRDLSLNMIRSLKNDLGISADVLVQ